ncbi:MDR/zinc-dependent alcohol dehydrogenase-like family protein [Shinella sp.]|uniref:MDR/zinc-dependent alcohol dehydrogenase-like family protein n=1 Tax=Shinella sp. TaxID=1870904 RepID=UPI0029B799F7|nr:zinc-binding dehydrogenase [Shinella sp.]MDX3977451.1 zinc-binding dehydrogenase [Shinella sp.]
MNIALPGDTTLMKAAVLTGPHTFDLRAMPMPAPARGQVRIRLEGCGVCASNVTPWEGPEWMTFPTEPGGLGHEGWGQVDAVGEGVTGISPGDRVAALSFHAYASHDLADVGNVVRLPPELDGMPFPGEPLGCAMNIFQRSDIGAGQTVAIVGIGFLGAVLTRLASAAGATVLAIGRRPFALKLAKRMGAAETIEMDDHWSVIEKVRSLTGGLFCDRVVEAAGKQWPLDLAGELTRERGRLVIAGYHQDGPRQVNMQMWNWRGLDVINAHERDPLVYVEGMRNAVRATAGGLIDPAGLITHRLPLERLSDALAMTRDRPEGFLKAIVEFR